MINCPIAGYVTKRSCIKDSLSLPGFHVLIKHHTIIFMFDFLFPTNCMQYNSKVNRIVLWRLFQWHALPLKILLTYRLLFVTIDTATVLLHRIPYSLNIHNYRLKLSRIGQVSLMSSM